MQYTIDCNTLKKQLAVIAYLESLGWAAGWGMKETHYRYVRLDETKVINGNKAMPSGKNISFDELFSIFESEPQEFEISSGYKAVVENGVTKVGCETIPFELLEKIYLAAKKSKE